MKLVLICFLFLSLNAVANSKVALTNGKIYIPNGFDDNDSVEVVVSGSLPDLCHRNVSYEVKQVKNKYIISLFSLYQKAPQGCRKIQLPYFETINLGILAKGEYQVELKNSMNTQSKSKLMVKGATSSLQDDFLYGNVMFVSENEANRWIEIKGTNPVNCLEFDRLDASIQGAVIVLKPLFKEVGECRVRSKSFSINYEVPYLPSSPRGIVLHIRTMNGKSYNYLYQNLVR